LLHCVQAHWGLDSVGKLIEFANANPAPDFSRLVPLIVRLAEQGDPIAREVLESAGVDLAYLVSLVIENIRSVEAESEEFAETRSQFQVPNIAVAGSILKHVPLVREAMTTSLQRQHPGLVVLAAPADPCVGALWNARYRH
jgi:glucosamine kinase